MRSYYLLDNQPITVQLDLDKMCFIGWDNNEMIFRYLKGAYPKRVKFIEFLQSFKDYGSTEEIDKFFLDGYDKATPYTYKEAFELTDPAFRAAVFDTVVIGEMIESLGHKMISRETAKVTHKRYSDSGELLDQQQHDSVYELHQVDGKALKVTDPLYAVRCWCPSTKGEHWVWVESKYNQDPLTAIASTFRVHANVIPFIKRLTRHGDVLLAEMKQEVNPTGEIVPLTKQQYFDLLTTES